MTTMVRHMTMTTTMMKRKMNTQTAVHGQFPSSNNSVKNLGILSSLESDTPSRVLSISCRSGIQTQQPYQLINMERKSPVPLMNHYETCHGVTSSPRLAR
eukprot:PhF_6_TR42944/c0_g1_i1/m.65262